MIHRREIHSPTGVLCMQLPTFGDMSTTSADGVTCELCVSWMKRIAEASEKHAIFGPLFPSAIPPAAASDLFAVGKSPAWRGDLLELLAKARAQGVHHLEVGADGSFKADLLPTPPPSINQPKNDKPETPEEQLERELFPER